MLTEEEKDELRRERADAKYHCRSTWKTILQLKKILAQYQADHYKWNRRFEAADLTLAEEEKLTRIPSPGKGKKKVKSIDEITMELTRSQIIQIADDLGIDLEIEQDESLRLEE